MALNYNIDNLNYSIYYKSLNHNMNDLMFVIEIDIKDEKNNIHKIKKILKNRYGSIEKNIDYFKLERIKIDLLDLNSLKIYNINGNIDHLQDFTFLKNEKFSIQINNSKKGIEIGYNIDL
jgi:S-adenosylmethionine hydrolase